MLARVKDGQSARVELALTVLPKPGASALAQVRQLFVLSYDLWEERFAVTLPGLPSRSVSHRAPADAEAWCLDQLTVPLSALAALGHDVPFWVRLEHRVLDGDASPPPEDASGFTLRSLIDALSPRRKADDAMRSIEAGPFRLRE